MPFCGVKVSSILSAKEKSLITKESDGALSPRKRPFPKSLLSSHPRKDPSLAPSLSGLE